MTKRSLYNNLETKISLDLDVQGITLCLRVSTYPHEPHFLIEGFHRQID